MPIEVAATAVKFSASVAVPEAVTLTVVAVASVKAVLAASLLRATAKVRVPAAAVLVTAVTAERPNVVPLLEMLTDVIASLVIPNVPEAPLNVTDAKVLVPTALFTFALLTVPVV